MTSNQTCPPCLAWKVFLNEKWPGSETTTHELRRIELVKLWANADQEYRDKYVEKARLLQGNGQELSNHEYYGNIPEQIIDAMPFYPCIRTDFSEENNGKWEKIKLLLKLDENLSPLHEEELPPIVEDERFQDLDLGSYAEQFIFGKANFKLMGMTESGKPHYYYHILMIADKRTFSDGTLIHVDFDFNGKPDSMHRYLAIDSYTPWTKHLNSRSTLKIIERNFFLQTGQSQRFDLSRPIVDIIRDEMERRGVNIEDAKDLRQLAHEAVLAVNPDLLPPQ